MVGGACVFVPDVYLCVRVCVWFRLCYCLGVLTVLQACRKQLLTSKSSGVVNLGFPLDFYSN